MKIKLLEGGRMPERADIGAAGFDLRVPVDFVIEPGRNIVPLNFKIQLEHGYEADIRPRSGFSAKGMEGHAMNNNGVSAEATRFNADVLLGCVDESYRGEVGVIVNSNEKVPFVVAKGTRIAQMVIQKYYTGAIEITEELDETDRGEGGFGHTGTK